METGGWPAGSYRFVVTVDTRRVTCEGSLPLPLPVAPSACGQGSSLKCDGAGVLISRSGCGLPAEQQGFSHIHVDGAPALVNIRTELDGTVEGIESFTPDYKLLRPNGPMCEPQCKQATGTLHFGPQFID